MRELGECKVAVLVPCYNESQTITKVVQDFQRELPDADIFVFDNNSTDGSFDLALNAGAIVIKEKRQGKGFVVNSMLKKVHADIYVMVDGDDTYPAENVLDLIRPLLEDEADMVVGQRLTDFSAHAFRPLHYTGNKVVCRLINLVFASDIQDPMSGYRAFTREVALEIPVLAMGFDVETEITLQMLYRKFKIKEVAIPYRERPKGSVSKLRTYRDGFRVLVKIFSILQAYKPLTFFGGIGLAALLVSVLVGVSVFREIQSAQGTFSVLKIVISATAAFAGLISITIGLIIHTINVRLLELSNQISKIAHKS